MATVTKPIILDETGQDIVAALQVIATHAAGLVGQGVPSGGTTGQVLKKKSNTDYDTEWGAESSVSPYTSNPAALGTASPGASDSYARGDHVHPKPTAADLGITVPSAYSSNPAMDGTASAGSSSSYAKGDHVHPHDTSRMTAAQVTAAINQALQVLSPEDIGAAPAVEVVVITDDGAVTLALNPDVIYEFAGTLTALTITLNAASAPAHYHFRFDSGSTAVSLTLPQTVVMPSGFQVEANKHYEIDILDGYGVAQSW